MAGFFFLLNCKWQILTSLKTGFRNKLKIILPLAFKRNVGRSGSWKIFFENPGNLPPGWTVENLVKKHASQPFNPEIANVLFRAGYIEAWGRGIEKKFKVFREFKIPEPELIVEETRFWMGFKFADSSDLAETPVENEENTENESKTPVEKFA